MSHVITSPILIGDLGCLLRALAKFPTLIFKHEQQTHAWYGKWVKDYHGADAAYKNGIDPETFGKCAHAISVAGCDYEIGLVPKQMADGTDAYALVWDFWGSGKLINKAIGDGGERLLTEYARQLAMQTASMKGMTYSEEVVGTDIVVTMNQY